MIHGFCRACRYACCITGEASLRMTLPMDMKKPNVAPDAAMYWPSVRIMPVVPAPYRKMLTVPEVDVSRLSPRTNLCIRFPSAYRR